MPKPFDATIKDLVQNYLPDYQRGLHLDDLGPLTLLNVDLSTITAATDIALGQGDPPRQVVDLNFQAGDSEDLPARILLYHGLLHLRYRVPVHSVVVLLRPAADRPRLTGKLHYQTQGGKGKMIFNYEVIRLWEWPVERVLQGGLGTLPLALLCKMPEKVPLPQALSRVVRSLAERLRREASPNDTAKLLTAAYVLSGLRISRELAKDIFQGVKAMKESTTYQGIIEEGRAEGLAEGARKIILSQGTERFGAPSKMQAKKLQHIADLEHLERLSLQLLKVSTWKELLETP